MYHAPYDMAHAHAPCPWPTPRPLGTILSITLPLLGALPPFGRYFGRFSRFIRGGGASVSSEGGSGVTSGGAATGGRAAPRPPEALRMTLGFLLGHWIEGVQAVHIECAAYGIYVHRL